MIFSVVLGYPCFFAVHHMWPFETRVSSFFFLLSFPFVLPSNSYLALHFLFFGQASSRFHIFFGLIVLVICAVLCPALGLALAFSLESSVMASLFVTFIASIFALWTKLIIVLAVQLWCLHDGCLQSLVAYLELVGQIFIAASDGYFRPSLLLFSPLFVTLGFFM